MKYLLYSILIVLLASCKSHKYSIVDKFSSTNKDSITLDTSYEFYLREIYKDSSDNVFSLKQESSTVKSKKNKLIEIEYLLYSERQAKVIYITTVPDKYQNYYSRYRLNDSTLLNAYDFNTFHIGKIKKDEGIVFRDIKKDALSFTWEIEKSKEYLSILHIIEKKGEVFEGEHDVRKSLSNGAVFKSIPQFKIVLRNFFSTNTDTLEMAKPIIYLGQRNKKYCELYFQFGDQIPVKRLFQNLRGKTEQRTENKNDQQSTTILFKGFKRIPYNPME